MARITTSHRRCVVRFWQAQKASHARGVRLESSHRSRRYSDHVRRPRPDILRLENNKHFWKQLRIVVFNGPARSLKVTTNKITICLHAYELPQSTKALQVLRQNLVVPETKIPNSVGRQAKVCSALSPWGGAEHGWWALRGPNACGGWTA